MATFLDRNGNDRRAEGFTLTTEGYKRNPGFDPFKQAQPAVQAVTPSVAQDRMKAQALDADSARLEESIGFRQRYPQGRAQMPDRAVATVNRARNERAQGGMKPVTIGSSGQVRPDRPSGSGVLDRLSRNQSNFAFNRAVMHGHGMGSEFAGSTVEDRSRRAAMLNGQIEQEAQIPGQRTQELALEQTRGQAQVDAARAGNREAAPTDPIRLAHEQALAREESLGRLYSAAGNMGAGSVPKEADTNGDGALSLDERLKYLEKLAKLTDTTYREGIKDPNTGEVTRPRDLRPEEAALKRAYEDAAGLNPGKTIGPRKPSLGELRASEDGATGSDPALAGTRPAATAGKGPQQPDPNVRTFQGKTWRFMGGDRRDQRNWRAE